MNETTSGAPLTATVGERLGDDPHVREVREEVAKAQASQEPGARAREGTTASRGASQGRAARAAVRARGGGAGGRPFPWGALALAAVGWAAITGIGRVARRGGRRVGAGARALVGRLPGR
jgi:hypothetical protein